MSNVNKSAQYIMRQSEFYTGDFVNLPLEPFLNELIIHSGRMFMDVIRKQMEFLITPIGRIEGSAKLPTAYELCASFSAIYGIPLRMESRKIGHTRYTVTYHKRAHDDLLKIIYNKFYLGGRDKAFLPPGAIKSDKKLYVSHIVSKSHKSKYSDIYGRGNYLVNKHMILCDACSSGLYLITDKPLTPLSKLEVSEGNSQCGK